MSASEHTCARCGACRATAEALARHVETHHTKLSRGRRLGLGHLWSTRLRWAGIDPDACGPIAPGVCEQCGVDRRGVVNLGRKLCVDCACRTADARTSLKALLNAAEVAAAASASSRAGSMPRPVPAGSRTCGSAATRASAPLDRGLGGERERGRFHQGGDLAGRRPGGRSPRMQAFRAGATDACYHARSPTGPADGKVLGSEPMSCQGDTAGGRRPPCAGRRAPARCSSAATGRAGDLVRQVARRRAAGDAAARPPPRRRARTSA